MGYMTVYQVKISAHFYERSRFMAAALFCMKLCNPMGRDRLQHAIISGARLCMISVLG